VAIGTNGGARCYRNGSIAKATWSSCQGLCVSMRVVGSLLGGSGLPCSRQARSRLLASLSRRRLRRLTYAPWPGGDRGLDPDVLQFAHSARRRDALRASRLKKIVDIHLAAIST